MRPVVTGPDGHSSNADYVTIAYTNAGAPMWTNRYNGPGNFFDGASAVTVDGIGNVFVTGTSWNSNVNGDPVNPAFATVAYSSIGLPLWTNLYSGPGNGNVAVRLAVDGSGNVVVTGTSESGST